MKERLFKLKDIPFRTEILTHENTGLILGDIAREREKSGNSENVINRIDYIQKQAKEMGDHTTVFTLYQEKFLCGQHMVMENRDKPLKIAKGVLVMKSMVGQMADYQRKHEDEIDPVVIARTPRFLGRLADRLHMYSQSEKYYRQSLEFFKQHEQINVRYQSLELSGFLSFSLLKQNNPDWSKLTQETLSAFDNSPEGSWLKYMNPYTWAVWKSGIEIRNSDALLDSKKLADQYRSNISEWLSNAGSILQMPNDNNDDFGIRRQELDVVTSKYNGIYGNFN